MRSLIVAIALLLPSPGEAAGLETIRVLGCSSEAIDFMVVVYPEQEQASVTIGTESQYYRYEPQGAFLTWQLVDDSGRPRYVLRQGDVINGDFGWYFSIPAEAAEGSAKSASGPCRVLESRAAQ